MVLESAVVGLLEELERISLEHEEVMDTDVRESVHRVLNCYFVWAHERSRFPSSFGMFSEGGDVLVANAIRQFLDTAEKAADLSSIPTGQTRLDILQASSAKTDEGMLYDEFIGHRDTPLPREPLPEHMFEHGDYGDDQE